MSATRPTKQGYDRHHNVVDIGHGYRDSTARKLAIAKARAEQESRELKNSACWIFLKLLLLIGMFAAFGFVYYRVAQLQCDVDGLYKRLDLIKSQMIFPSEEEPKPDPPRNNYHSDNWPWMDFGRDYLRDRYRHRTPHRDFNDTTLRRKRRSTSGSDQSGHSGHPEQDTNGIGPMRTECGGHFARHLVPEYPRNITINANGNLLKWRDADNSSFLRKPGFELVNEGRYLMAPVSGHYYVYSQVTYQDNSRRTIGHQLGTRGQCGRGDFRLVLTTVITQDRRSEDTTNADPRDSLYTGGVVYLSAGDVIGVLPKFGIENEMNVTRTDLNSFFGAFLVSRNDEGKNIIQACPYGFLGD